MGGCTVKLYKVTSQPRGIQKLKLMWSWITPTNTVIDQHKVSLVNPHFT